MQNTFSIHIDKDYFVCYGFVCRVWRKLKRFSIRKQKLSKICYILPRYSSFWNRSLRLKRETIPYGIVIFFFVYTLYVWVCMFICCTYIRRQVWIKGWMIKHNNIFFSFFGSIVTISYMLLLEKVLWRMDMDSENEHNFIWRQCHNESENCIMC